MSAPTEKELQAAAEAHKQSLIASGICQANGSTNPKDHIGPFKPLVRDRMVVDVHCACGAWRSEMVIEAAPVAKQD